MLHLSFSIYFMKQIICRIQHVEEVLFKNGSRYLLRSWTRYFSLQILLLKSIETFNWSLPKTAVSGTRNFGFNSVIYGMKHIRRCMDQPWKNNRFLWLIKFKITSNIYNLNNRKRLVKRILRFPCVMKNWAFSRSQPIFHYITKNVCYTDNLTYVEMELWMQ